MSPVHRLLHINLDTTPPEVQAAIAWAKGFFESYPPSYNFGKSLTNQARYYAGLLGQYNEGQIGPGHCSE